MVIKLLAMGTREQKENKAENTGTKTVFFFSDILGNTENQNRKNAFRNKGSQEKVWEQGNTDPPGRPSLCLRQRNENVPKKNNLIPAN